jgi:hypothetical protein
MTTRSWDGPSPNGRAAGQRMPEIVQARGWVQARLGRQSLERLAEGVRPDGRGQSCLTMSLDIMYLDVKRSC